MLNLITIIGSEGFIGKNLTLYLKSHFNKIEVFEVKKKTNHKTVIQKINNSDIIINCAGVNRSKSNSEFDDNFKICQFITENLNSLKKQKLIHISTTKVFDKNLYGITKKRAEKELISFKKKNISIRIIRCPNIYGKWSKPNYNSVVATFCNNIIRKKPINIFNGNKPIELVYIDDLCEILLKEIKSIKSRGNYIKIENKFVTKTTPKIILDKIKMFQYYRYKKFIPEFKDAFNKNLYSTFLTYLPKKFFKYELEKISDKRGSFVEFIKSKNFGQVSYIKINSKLSRGNHYHISKVEKFLLLNGKCEFEFKNMKNPSEKIRFIVNSNKTEIIETIPGWLHSLKNLSNFPIYLIIWANEVFDKKKTDTYQE